MSLTDDIAAAIAIKQDQIASLANAHELPANPSMQLSLAEQKAHYSHEFFSLRGALDIAVEYEQKALDVARVVADLTAIREVLTLKLIDLPTRPETRSDMCLRTGLTVSILILDGRFDPTVEAVPDPLPLFEMLRAKGYVGAPGAEWNPLSSISNLPTMQRELVSIEKRLDVARATLVSVAPREEETTK